MPSTTGHPSALQVHGSPEGLTGARLAPSVPEGASSVKAFPGMQSYTPVTSPRSPANPASTSSRGRASPLKSLWLGEEYPVCRL